jgi:cyclic beta-1,2-glucan synthetase
VRENGGQYTHAASWVGWAFADIGDGTGAMRVFDLLNPIHHANDLAAVNRYRVEPYVVAADIASVPPHAGQGGWTWYTGSAAWLYRLGIERIVGLRPEGGKIRIEPCLPPDWRRVAVKIRGEHGQLSIVIDNPDGVSSGIVRCSVDGIRQERPVVSIPQDGSERQVVVHMASSAQRRRSEDESVGSL